MSYIKGIYMQDIFINEDNGYMVGLIKVKESDISKYINKTVTFTGIFNDLKYKTTYKMNGEFVTHNKYGMQFQTDSYELILPTEEEEIIEFLSSELFPIGVKTAEKIVGKFGKDSINIIINEPDKLKDIPRLKEANIEKMNNILKDYELTSSIILLLSKLGFSTKNAISMLKKYSSNVTKIVENNIYNIIDDIDIPFDELDKIARNNGYNLNDERRLLALAIHCMNNITFSNGDTYSYFDEIYEYIYKKTDNITREEMEYILIKLSKLEKIKIVNDRYYLTDLFDSEEYIANRLISMKHDKVKKISNFNNLLNQIELINNIKYDDSQKDAIEKAINNNLTIITGGPGTGKTTIIKCICKLLLATNSFSKEKIALLAPTGRAARKLMETTGLPAYTIHKYLKWDKENNTFEVNEYCPNKESYVIVDEASMIDTVLMSCLLKGITRSAKIILVGDYYQLPSVSQGQVLKDIIDSKVIDVIKLNCLYRQSEDSYITTLAYEIKNKETSENFLLKYDDYNFIICKNEEILSSIKNIVTKALSKGYTEKDIQVLAPIYRSSTGIDALNKVLQEIFNPRSYNKNEITSGDIIYREGDKILQLVNDSDNLISNGDIGYIESISKNKNKNQIVINFDGNRVTYTPKDFINITHGYAISVHKSQGGEFKMVIIPFSPSYKIMLYNKLIYTAVTRAKEKLLLIGDPQSFIYAVKNDYVENRKTSLKELLINKYK